MDCAQEMDLKTDFSARESVEDNEETVKDSVLERLGDFSESEFCNNVSCAMQYNDDDELFPEVKKNEPEVLGCENLPESKFGKGYCLKKWKRIKRDVSKDDKMGTQKLMESPVNSNKQMQDERPRKQKIEASVSSTYANVRTIDLGLGSGAPVAVGTDSENSGDWSTKSSAAASTPKIKFEKNKMGNLGGKNLMESAHGQLGNGQILTSKKARGEQVKIEMENSHSSMQSDLQSSNFVFMQGSYNGVQHGRLKGCQDTCDGTQGSKPEVGEGHYGAYDRASKGEYKDLSPEDLIAALSSEVKDERSDDHGYSGDQDPLVESIFALQSAQEVLENELLKVKGISNDTLVNESVSDLNTEFIDADPRIQQISLEANRDVETELDDLFKQKIEMEVEYLVISRMVQKLRVASVDQITVLEEQKDLASEHARILSTLRDAGNKATVLKTAAKKLESACEDIVVADETMKLQSRVCKYGLCFLLQFVLLVGIITVFVHRTSQNYMEPAPT